MEEPSQGLDLEGSLPSHQSRAKAAILSTQRMGNLPEERISPNSKPFTAICLDLLGPTMVKAMTNK